MEDKGQGGKRKGGMEGIGKRERNGHQERAYRLQGVKVLKKTELQIL